MPKGREKEGGGETPPRPLLREKREEKGQFERE